MPSDHGSSTANDIRDVVFSKPPIGQRGYHEDQVDEFLDALEAKFTDPADPRYAQLTADTVRQVSFGPPPLGIRGYNKDEVDAFLQICARRLAALTAAVPVDHARAHTTADMTAEHIRQTRFPRSLLRRGGYDQQQVDRFLDTVAAKFADPAEPSLAWLTPSAIAEARFAPSAPLRPGYSAGDVDGFLARCAADLAALLSRE